MAETTKTIAGMDITLEEGRRYLAASPMGTNHVDIHPYGDNGFRMKEAVWDLDFPTYEERVAFLTEFNNGKISFEGRVW